MKKKLIRITTVPISLDKLLEGQLNFMNSFYDVVAVSADYKYLKLIGKKENVRVFPINMTRKITLIKDLIALIKLVKFLIKEKPLIVHTHTPKAGIIGMLASKISGVPIRIHTVAGLPLLETQGFKRKILNFVEKLTYSCATNVYPNSFGLKQIIIQNKLIKNAKKLKVIANGSSNGINLDYFNPEIINKSELNKLRDQLKIKKDDLVFVFIGRIVKDKGINELIYAFNKLDQAKIKSVKLLLVGPFEEDLDPIDYKAKEIMQANNNIISVGWQQDVRKYLLISNILTFPSYREGFPNVVLQAGAMGLPCIVSNINGCNEIINEKINGLIVPSKNESKLYEAMLYLVENGDKMLKFGKNSRKLIKEKYDQKKVWKAIKEEYQILINNLNK
ncbi:MAG: glycosyltransferase family 4 protein [Lutibacter sp.]